ncbi:FAD-linked oxidoreductase-like protein [Multifurca ochricompacta]|uniref:Proline dehydrogenase n=1 Tax=Multifurca ochricompacta TaxID=376703 RepID=A0AAD4MC40_9AGAM|nr:FAD-linked oxidoreductase-like protein [Multifurca ochricompacta]
MLAHSFKRQVLVSSSHTRCCRGFQAAATRSPRTLKISAASSGALAASLMAGLGYSFYADPSPSLGERVPTPLSKLVTSYVVYSMCSIPGLVEASPALLAFCTSIPGLRQLTEAFVRATFFTQFVGGDTAHACLPLIRQLRAENKGALFAYSVEVDAKEAAGGASSTREPVHKRVMQEMIRSIDAAADFEDSQPRANGIPGSGRRTWVAIKLSALLPNSAALLHLSAHISSLHVDDTILFPGCPHGDDLAILHLTEPPSDSHLSTQDLADLRELHKDLIRICTRARARNVRLIVDAEHSWYQPAVDAISLTMMREFNKDPSSLFDWTPRSFSRLLRPASPPPLIYVTFQAYLRRTPEYVSRSLQDAASHKYALGSSSSASESPSLALTTNSSWPPVFTKKTDTDRCYEAAAVELVRAVANADGRGPSVGVLFGSHNAKSCDKVLDALISVGLATHEGDGIVRVGDHAAERVSLAQLYGVSICLGDCVGGKC